MKFYLGTNWKMHKTVAEALAYTEGLAHYAKDYPQFQFFIIPSYTALWQVRQKVDALGAPIWVGAQNTHWEDQGAFTGEISPVQLKEIGLDLVEIGHSERRQYYNETDFTVNLKTLAALKHGFKALVCVGENMPEKEHGASKSKIATQVQIALNGVKAEDLPRVMIAYEPVWAIGEKGIPAEAPYVFEIHESIRKTLCELYGEQGREVPIFFGGSVNLQNCQSYCGHPDVNGLFIGSTAWQPDSFHQVRIW